MDRCSKLSMSYITFPGYINMKNVFNINNDIFVIEEMGSNCLFLTKNVHHLFMVVSLKNLFFYYQKKERKKSFEEFIPLIIGDFPNRSRCAKKNTYLCFFYHSQYSNPALENNFTTFTTIDYDNYKEILLLVKELVIKDLFPVVWKLLFSLLVTDKSSIKNNKIASYNTTYIGSEPRDIIYASLPIYMFND
jgi:hypothetical protein